MINLINKIFLRAKHIGTDEFGNKYFIGKNNKRSVSYNGIAEPSKVPMQWHGWLHYNTDELPSLNNNNKKFSWQKIHTPNLTGTKHRYTPNLSTTKKTNSNYESWQPNNS